MFKKKHSMNLFFLQETFLDISCDLFVGFVDMIILNYLNLHRKHLFSILKFQNRTISKYSIYEREMHSDLELFA